MNLTQYRSSWFFRYQVKNPFQQISLFLQFKALDRVGIRPEEIQLIILTRGHWDHIGSTAEIKRIQNIIMEDAK